MHRCPLLATALLAGCGSAVELPQEQSGPTTGAVATTTTAVADPASTTNLGPGLDSSSTDLDSISTTLGTTTGSEVADTDCSFLCNDSSDMGLAFECSLWDQDCPTGTKCSPWAHEVTWDWLSCFPVDPDPDAVGEPCTVGGSGMSGLDSCEVGAICWDVDPATDTGTCVPHCNGSESSPTCADPSRHCVVAYGGIVTLCLPQCDPLAATLCPEGSGCYPIEDAFICALDASDEAGGLLEPCEYTNACEAGLVCGQPQQVGALCDADAPGCCLPVCDLNDPACPPQTVCTPFFESGAVPPDYTDVGICADAVSRGELELVENRRRPPFEGACRAE